MQHLPFPLIDPVATGKNIKQLRENKGLTVHELQVWFNFVEPRAIYKWQSGKSLPSLDHLYALSKLFEVPMEDILVHTNNSGSQSNFCEAELFLS